MSVPDTLTFAVVELAACLHEAIQFRNRNRASPRDHEYFQWRYLRRPASMPPFVVWAKIGSRPVGAASVAPHDFWVRDAIYPVGILGDISVDTEQRGKGIAGRMLGFLRDHPMSSALRGSFVMPTPEAAAALGKAGWRNVTAAKRYVRLVDIQRHVVSRFGAGGAYLAALGNMFLQGLGASYAKNVDYEDAELESFDGTFDDLWERALKSGTILGVRSRAYLNWRYKDHPDAHYRIYALYQRSRLAGYVVFFIEGGLIWIEDFFAVDDRTLRSTIARFVAQAHRRQLGEAVHVRVAKSKAFGFPWYSLGFVTRSDRQEIMVKDVASNGDLYDGSRWFITAGDKDV